MGQHQYTHVVARAQGRFGTRLPPSDVACVSNCMSRRGAASLCDLGVLGRPLAVKRTSSQLRSIDAAHRALDGKIVCMRAFPLTVRFLKNAGDVALDGTPFAAGLRDVVGAPMGDKPAVVS
jgi:hypothetical protein